MENTIKEHTFEEKKLLRSGKQDDYVYNSKGKVITGTPKGSATSLRLTYKTGGGEDSKGSKQRVDKGD